MKSYEWYLLGSHANIPEMGGESGENSRPPLQRKNEMDVVRKAPVHAVQCLPVLLIRDRLKEKETSNISTHYRFSRVDNLLE